MITIPHRRKHFRDVAYVPLSDGSAYNFEFDDLTGYVETAGGSGSTSQITFDGESVFKLQTGTGIPSPTNSGIRNNLSAFTLSADDPYVCSIRPWVNRAGDFADGVDNINFIAGIDSARICGVSFYNDVIRVKDYFGVQQLHAYTPVYSALVWYDFVVDRSGTPWTADVYQNGILILNDIGFGQPLANSGRVSVAAVNSVTTDNTIAYFDKILIGGLA